MDVVSRGTIVVGVKDKPRVRHPAGTIVTVSTVEGKRLIDRGVAREATAVDRAKGKVAEAEAEAKKAAAVVQAGAGKEAVEQQQAADAKVDKAKEAAAKAANNPGIVT